MDSQQISQNRESFFTPKEWQWLVLFRPREWRAWWQTEPFITKALICIFVALALIGACLFWRGDSAHGWGLVITSGAALALVIVGAVSQIFIAGMRWLFRRIGIAWIWRRVGTFVEMSLYLAFVVGVFSLIVAGVWPYLSSNPMKVWYAATNGVPANHVEIAEEPHDCDFLKAPIGEKFCHYEAIVIRDPAPPNRPKYLKVTYVRMTD